MKNKIANITKSTLYQWLSGIFIGCLLISNILASKTFVFCDSLGIILPCAVIIFPIVYIVNDVLAEIYGYTLARRVIFLGFALNIIAVIAYNIAIILPSPIFNSDVSKAFSVVLSSTPRVLLASFLAYLIGSVSNAKIMQVLHDRMYNKLMFRCIGSTVVGEGLDAIIFISVAFYGTMGTRSLLIMILAQATFKVVYEIIIYPITRRIIMLVRTLND